MSLDQAAPRAASAPAAAAPWMSDKPNDGARGQAVVHEPVWDLLASGTGPSAPISTESPMTAASVHRHCERAEGSGA
jgi:hypothetical protein